MLDNDANSIATASPGAKSGKSPMYVGSANFMKTPLDADLEYTGDASY